MPRAWSLHRPADRTCTRWRHRRRFDSQGRHDCYAAVAAGPDFTDGPGGREIRRLIVLSRSTAHRKESPIVPYLYRVNVDVDAVARRCCLKNPPARTLQRRPQTNALRIWLSLAKKQLILRH